FPAAVTEDEFHAARAALIGRRNMGGRTGRRGVNLFAGLLTDARDGCSMHLVDKGDGPLIVNGYAVNGVPGSKFVSFPSAVFEHPILSKPREIDPRVIAPFDEAGAADAFLALTGRLAALEARAEKIEARLVDDGDLDSLVKVLRELKQKRAAVE